MRKIQVKNYQKSVEFLSLIFFTQALEELLYDHSSDSYKAPALSSDGRIGELLKLVDDSRDAGIGQDHLSPFIAELKWSISNELVLTTDERSFCLNILNQLPSDSGKPDLIISKLKTIRLSFDGYFSKIWALLKSKLLEKDFSRSDIYQLAVHLVSQTEYEGYHRRYISRMTKKHLVDNLSSKTKIDIGAIFDEFAGKFDKKDREWDIYVQTNSEITNYENYSAPFGIKVLDAFPEFPEWDCIKCFKQKYGAGRSLVQISDVHAFDAETARNIAVEFIEGFLSTVSFCCHDKVINYFDPILLNDKTTNFWLLIDVRPNPMVLGNRSEASEVSNDLQQVINPFLNRKLSAHSARKMLNAFEYHRAALESRLPENQLVDLWAALEGFLPSPDGTRIKYFCNTLSSVLTLTYTEKILRVFYDNLIHEGKKINDLIDSISVGTTKFEKVIALISARELEDKRKEIAQIIANSNPLLLYRFYQLNENYKSKKRIGATLKKHQEKITWHIHRIYYSRNLIVHSASSLPYLPTLVENLHTYLDTLIRAITSLARKHVMGIDVDTAVSTLASHEKHLIQDYTISDKNPDIECNLNNFWELVFGAVNPLAPLH